MFINIASKNPATLIFLPLGCSIITSSRNLCNDLATKQKCIVFNLLKSSCLYRQIAPILVTKLVASENVSNLWFSILNSFRSCYLKFIMSGPICPSRN